MTVRSVLGRVRLWAMALVVLMLALRVLDPVAIERLREQSFDLLQQIKPRPYVSAPVAVVDIDDASLQELGQWPWPRSLVAELVTAIAGQGAVVIGLDILFSEPDRLSAAQIRKAFPDLPEDLATGLQALPETDSRLAAAMGTIPVVLGQSSLRSVQSGYTPGQPVRTVGHAMIGGDATEFLPRYPALIQNLPVLEEAAAGRGVFTVVPDGDGVFRRLPLALLVGGTLRLGLSAEILRVGTGGRDFALRSNAAGVDALILAGKAIPTAGDGTVRPWLSARNAARFVPAADLLTGRAPLDRLRGHMVIIGTSAIGLEDFRATPLGIAMPGAEIHAQVIEAILSGALLHRPNYAIGAELVGIALVGLFLLVLLPVLPARGAVATGLGLSVALGIASWAAFASQLVLLDASLPILTALAVTALIVTANYLREERQRRAIRTAFGQYVSPDLVARLAESPETLRLGGEERELTVLFSDVRGFTTLAEGYRARPEALAQLMNRLMTRLSDAVLGQGGTIDKFMGDAIMAFWNAPLDHPSHAEAACRAALAMVTAPPDDAAGQKALAVGVGINTGPAIVGNMGSTQRFDYTALGDTVNLAARLEGQSKVYGVPIVIGADTAGAVRDRLAVTEIDLLRVRGKSAPEHVFALWGDEALRDSADFARFEASNRAMLAAFRQQDWAGARQAADDLLAGDGPLALQSRDYTRFYLAQIARFEQSPPGPDWSGARHAEGAHGETA